MADPQSRKRNVRALVVVATVIVGLYALVVFVLGAVPVNRSTTLVCEQADDLTYDERDPYAVYARVPDFTWGLSAPPVEAAVAATGTGGSYGIFVALGPTVDGADDLTCAWTEDGVTITEPNGITHTVPAEAFTGGR